MEMTGEIRIPAPRETVWAALNDPEVLKACIPGCESLTKTSDTEMTAAVTAKVGPVKAKFTGAVTLSDIRPPEGYTISGEGKGGVAGFAKGGASVALEADGPDTTILRYTAKAQVGGKLAQLGARLIDSTAKKMADEFFGAFSARVGGGTAAVAPAVGAAAAGDAAMPIEPASPAENETLIEEAEHALERTEEQLEVAAGKGFLGGPVTWGFLAVAVLIVLLWLFH